MALVPMLGVGSARGSASAATPAPVSTRENVAFWYSPVRADTDLRVLGHPAVLVHGGPVAGPDAERATVARLRAATGAALYRYVELYWLPVRRPMMGVDLARHPDWAFCRSGTRPLAASALPGGPKGWRVVDTNERAVVAAFRTYLLHVKAWGWDGIFLDVAHRAMAEDVWDDTSTCTGHPVGRGRTGADAYAALVPLARRLGLQVMVNGGPPDGPPVGLRPDPADPACRRGAWRRCRVLDDVVRSATWILHEGAAETRDHGWRVEERAREADARFRRGSARVALFGAEHGPARGRRARIAYQWATMKLTGLPVAFGTGIGGCPGHARGPVWSRCDRDAVAPVALVDSQLGPPLGGRPRRVHCARGGWRCVWIRRFEHGLVVVNDSAQPRRTGPIAPGVPCSELFDLTGGAPTRPAACGAVVSWTAPPFSGRVLEYDHPG